MFRELKRYCITSNEVGKKASQHVIIIIIVFLLLFYSSFVLCLQEVLCTNVAPVLAGLFWYSVIPQIGGKIYTSYSMV